MSDYILKVRQLFLIISILLFVSDIEHFISILRDFVDPVFKMEHFVLCFEFLATKIYH